jgi:predicted ester cyclase
MCQENTENRPNGEVLESTPVLPGSFDLTDFATRYTAAWCSQNPESVAAFYSIEGSLRVNDGPPAAGRHAITLVAQSFMSAFPDLSVTMESVRVQGDEALYHWTLSGTNTGLGGTGRRVRISGFEQWRIGSDGLIATSQGHFDAAEYQRQLEKGV